MIIQDNHYEEMEADYLDEMQTVQSDDETEYDPFYGATIAIDVGGDREHVEMNRLNNRTQLSDHQCREDAEIYIRAAKAALSQPATFTSDAKAAIGYLQKALELMTEAEAYHP